MTSTIESTICIGCGHKRELHHDNLMESELICDGCESCNELHSDFEDAPRNNKHILLCMACGVIYDNPLNMKLIKCLNCESERIEVHKMCQCDGTTEFMNKE